jgi:GntR family histidine utilization transcriptional repressor
MAPKSTKKTTPLSKDLKQLKHSIHSAGRSPQPIYRKIKKFIEHQILSGAWQPDMKIPSENQFVEALGTSRMTVNRALRELTADGHLVRLHGIGTFVAPPRARSALLEIRSIAEEIRNRGGVHTSELHLLEQEPASPHIAAAMGLPTRAPIYHSVTVHRDSGLAVQLSDRHVNPQFAPDYIKQDFSKITPSEYLLKVAYPDEAEHLIEASLPDEQTQSLLEMDASEPCLILHRMTWVSGLMATSNRIIWPGSRHSIGGRFRPVSRR